MAKHAAPDHVYHYRHGWIPIDGAPSHSHRSADVHAARALGHNLGVSSGGVQHTEHDSEFDFLANAVGQSKRHAAARDAVAQTGKPASATKIAERVTGKPPVQPSPARSADRVATQALSTGGRPGRANITEDQRYALKVYTSSAYGPINNALRTGTPVPANLAPQVAHMDAALAAHPLQQPLETRRTIGLDAFGIGWQFGHGLTGDPATLKGKTFHDNGFMSTRADMKRDGNDPAMIALTFEVPRGVGAVDVSHFSNAPAEKEIVLQRGLSYQITDVHRDPDGFWSGTARVLPPRGGV